MSYKIETGITPPPPSTRKSFPFDQMKVGDSFLEVDYSKINSLKVAATTYNRTTKKKIFMSVRKDKGGFRCFAISSKLKSSSKK